MNKYKAVLFAPDGDWVTDFKGDTQDEVEEQLANKGSRWLFYPFEGIILDRGALTTARQRLVNVFPPLELVLIGLAIKTVGRYIRENMVR